MTETIGPKTKDEKAKIKETKARKPRAAKVKPLVTEPLPAATEPHVDHLGHYALAGVIVMSGMSAGLNGYAHSLHATIPWAGWGLGILIPIIILILGKVAGILWSRGDEQLTYVTAGSGIGLLVLSVWHCTTSIALLTGSPLLLAAPMAIAIDVGFVCLELSATRTKD